MNKLIFIVICGTITFCSCKYFSEPQNHDQEFAEKVAKEAMIKRFNGKLHYENISFGSLQTLKDSIINLNGKKINLKNHHWLEIQNKYLIKDADGNVVKQNNDWLLVDSALDRAACCMVK